ncbi:hypothetical protein, partial [Staphylococcus aureus]|uniref:PDC sensor domain-containing protein n=1 Tax=Staphylococcus aureus TaxID=1280 RepID=UPI0039BDF382
GMVLSNANTLLSVVLADDSALRMEPQECSSFVNRVFHNQSDLANLGIIDAHHKLVCTPDAAKLGIDMSDRAYLNEIMATGRPSLSTFLTGRASNQAVLISARPMAAGDGAIRGVAYAAVRPSALLAA